MLRFVNCPQCNFQEKKEVLTDTHYHNMEYHHKQLNCCSWIASVKVNACANLKHNRMFEGIY